ncbi:MAG: DUF459 domain-containing protein [Pseudomonadota bacterium]
MRRHAVCFAAGLMVAAASVWHGATLAYATEPDAAASVAAGAVTVTSGMIAPTSSRDRQRLVVIGDSVGANLADGLKWAFRRSKIIKVSKRTKAGTGLARPDVYNWPRALRRVVRRERPDILVLLIGGNDRQDMRHKGRRYERFSKPWSREYVRRLERFADQLEESGAQIFWIGLPNVRSARMTRDYHRFNAWVRKAARARGQRFIPIRHLFETNGGGYSAYGRSVRGKRVRLRSRDGIHMSRHGSYLMGRYVAQEIMSDLPARIVGTASAKRAEAARRKDRKVQ